MDELRVPSFKPAYLELSKKDWEKKIKTLENLSSPCRICPRNCKAKRLSPKQEEKLGVCKTGSQAIVASVGPHFGEEPPLVGRSGSGTIFFANCNLGCFFCQNYHLAHFGEGRVVSDEELAQMMLRIQALGCHNLNLVSPTHVVLNIVKALEIATKKGFRLPIVYNTGGYDALKTIQLLNGIIDIYMPDMKYGYEEPANDFSLAPNYPQANFQIVKEMHRQVGDLEMDKNGVAQRGLLIRHLVLPNDLAGTEKVMKFLVEEISSNTYVNIMAQYRPYFKAIEHPVLGRRITDKEYQRAVKIAQKLGLNRLA